VHIVQPIRVIGGKLVVFGEGNLISNQTSACCPAAAQDGMIVLLTITVDSRGARVSFIHYLPIWVRHPTMWSCPPASPGAPIPPMPPPCAPRIDARSQSQGAVPASSRSPPTCHKHRPRRRGPSVILDQQLAGTGLTEPQWVILTLAVTSGETAEREQFTRRVAGALKISETVARARAGDMVTARQLRSPASPRP
jgi:hypothetical protein